MSVFFSPLFPSHGIIRPEKGFAWKKKLKVSCWGGVNVIFLGTRRHFVSTVSQLQFAFFFCIGFVLNA